LVGDVEQGPCRRGDRDSAQDADVGAVQSLHPVCADTRSSYAPANDRDVDHARRVVSYAEQTTYRVMAHHRSTRAGVQGRPSVHPRRLDPGAPAEHAGVQAVQQAARDAMLDCASPEPEVPQLIPRDQRILAGRHEPDQSVHMSE